MIAKSLLFLAWESPWPAHSGAALRSLGLLTELRRSFNVDLLVLTRQPLSDEQSAVLGSLVQSVKGVPLRDTLPTDTLRSLSWIGLRGYPYHSAVLEASLANSPQIKEMIVGFPGIVFTSTGHWGTLVHGKPAPNWILNQCDADVEFWRVYATQVSQPLVRLVARINYRLARRHYPRIYANVGCVISVCEQDRQHTLALAPQAKVHVIENGVDCSFYLPHRETRAGPPRLLFTGTSVARNMTALHDFTKNVLPLVRSQMSDVELLVGGNFSVEAQSEFAGIQNMRFTGRIDDMRPVFNQSDVFIAPFAETHGSKLKIAEAIAMAMPIVSTPQGVRGFPLVDGDSVLIAYSHEQFAAQIIRLLRDNTTRNRLSSAARFVAETKVDWQVLGKRLVQIVEATQEQARPE